ncbi:MAG: hypothetical protein WDM88_11755 [Galbitalea sp.]
MAPPTWLAGSFADPEYPEVVAQFAGAFAARYRGIVDHITPLNEPLTTASFCGLRGVWPPALTGWDGWTTVTLGIVFGISRTIEAVRAANPNAVIVHVEAATIYQTSAGDLKEHATELSAVGMLPLDLLLGRVDTSHEMYDWLLENGAPSERLASLVVDVPEIDLLGVNYYPDLSPRTPDSSRWFRVSGRNESGRSRSHRVPDALLGALRPPDDDHGNEHRRR